MAGPELDLPAALDRGDPDAVAALIAAGADIRFKQEHGYDALLHAVHNRDVARDPRLLELLRLLIVNGADLNGISSYQESGLRVLSHIGRFDGVRLLLGAGADKGHLQWTPLIEAVALGSLEEMERLVLGGAALEETDWWSRTAWLVALLVGDIAKVQRLRELGANIDARGRCGQPPLFYAVQGHHRTVVHWLLEIGQDVDQMDEFGNTPLMEAVEHQDLECVDTLIAAGADVDHKSEAGSVLWHVGTAELAKRLLDAGADPGELSREGSRALCGLGEVRERLTDVSEQEFRRARTRVFGTSNPQEMREPFWEGMIRAGISGYTAAQQFEPGAPHGGSPVWCASRFGQSITFLPDGRIVQIGGEHEDYYDPDFCIYNDVFVHGLDGSIAIFGYPEDVIAPTDFHTATLLDGAIYVIGSLGYAGSRRYGETPVCRLDVSSFRIERLDTSGEGPGWIYDHRSVRLKPHEIRVSGGKIVTGDGTKETHTDNADAFVLDIERRLWRRDL